MLVYKSSGQCYCGRPIAPDDKLFCHLHSNRHHYRCLICGAQTLGANKFCSPSCEAKGLEILKKHGVTSRVLRQRYDGFVYLCAVCGKPVKDPNEFAYCSVQCKQKARIKFPKPVSGDSFSFSNGQGPPRETCKKHSSDYTRKCHDCGKATTQYRCPECHAAWRRKYGVESQGD